MATITNMGNSYTIKTHIVDARPKAYAFLDFFAMNSPLPIASLLFGILYIVEDCDSFERRLSVFRKAAGFSRRGELVYEEVIPNKVDYFDLKRVISKLQMQITSGKFEKTLCELQVGKKKLF